MELLAARKGRSDLDRAKVQVDSMVREMQRMIERMKRVGDNPRRLARMSKRFQRYAERMKKRGDQITKDLSKSDKKELEAYAKKEVEPLIGDFVAAMVKAQKANAK